MADGHSTELAALQAAVGTEYAIERELGRGGMGIVYLARDVRLDRPVALKVLPPHLNAQPEIRERFLREARTAAQLSHPNIVPVFRADEADGHAFFVMGYVDGESLADRVRDRGPLPPAEAVRFLREVAWALAYAHARGVVHRDVKPENIMVERGSARAVVTDFGIARVEANPRLTQDGYVLGTVHFMSPEQVAGDRLDGRSDLYSLGIVGFHALSGRLPFEGEGVAAVLVAHATRPAPSLASVAPAVPRGVAEVIDRCLRKRPDERFPTGEALAEALGKAIAAAETELVSEQSGARAVMSEHEAAAVWRRAAQLQAEAAQRLEERARRRDALPPGGGATPASGYRVRDVEAAAVEAGISQQFVALAMAELKQSDAIGVPRPLPDWQERAATRLLGLERRSLGVSRVIRASRRRVLQALGRLLPAHPFSLAFREHVGPHPLDGGILVFDFPPMMTYPYAWTYVRYGTYAKQMRVQLRPTADPAACEVELSIDLRQGVRANLFGTAGLSAGMAAAGGGAGLAIGAKALALGGALLGLPVAAGALVLGLGGVAGYVVMYRYSLGKARDELDRVLAAVEGDVRTEELFGAPLAPQAPPPALPNYGRGDDAIAFS
jgi:predicted Ser/Thr protein kinase